MLLSKLNNQRIIFFFIIYLLFIIISSIIYGYLINIKNNIYDENYNIIFLNIPFSNGELIYNLFYNKKYFTNFNDINFYLQKTPAIPFLILIISLISKNFYFIIIIKNILVFSFYFFCCFKISHYENKNYLFFFILLFIPIIILYNFSVAINFFYEDSLIAILLPLLFLTLITNYKYKYLLISIILFVLYFVKTSMFFIISFVPILLFF